VSQTTGRSGRRARGGRTCLCDSGSA
jgi:hypothetical protein